METPVLPAPRPRTAPRSLDLEPEHQVTEGLVDVPDQHDFNERVPADAPEVLITSPTSIIPPPTEEGGIEEPVLQVPKRRSKPTEPVGLSVAVPVYLK